MPDLFEEEDPLGSAATGTALNEKPATFPFELEHFAFGVDVMRLGTLVCCGRILFRGTDTAYHRIPTDTHFLEQRGWQVDARFHFA